MLSLISSESLQHLGAYYGTNGGSGLTGTEALASKTLVEDLAQGALSEAGATAAGSWAGLRRCL